MSIQTMISAASGVIETPDLWERRLPTKFSDICPRLVETAEGFAWVAAGKMGKTLTYSGLPPETGAGRLRRSDVASYASPEGRKWIQGRDGVNAEVLYSLGDVWDLVNASDDREFINAVYRGYNDWIAELSRTDPERFIGIAKIPTSGIEDATKELVRASKELGLRGACLDRWPGGAKTPPAAKTCDSFWEAAASLNMPISIYRPLNGSTEELGDAPEFVQDIVAIMYANVFDRFPDLKVVAVSPTTGWAPHMFESMNEGYMRTANLRKVSLGDPDLLPSDYLRRFVWFTNQEDRTGLLNRTYFGSAHLMWASFAFLPQSVWPNTRQLFERLSAGIPEPEREVLASQVASRLYGLGSAQPFTKDEQHEYLRYGLL